jgi:hypothetical protein
VNGLETARFIKQIRGINKSKAGEFLKDALCADV